MGLVLLVALTGCGLFVDFDAPLGSNASSTGSAVVAASGAGAGGDGGAGGKGGAGGDGGATCVPPRAFEPEWGLAFTEATISSVVPFSTSQGQFLAVAGRYETGSSLVTDRVLDAPPTSPALYLLVVSAKDGSISKGYLLGTGSSIYPQDINVQMAPLGGSEIVIATTANTTLVPIGGAAFAAAHDLLVQTVDFSSAAPKGTTVLHCLTGLEDASVTTNLGSIAVAAAVNNDGTTMCKIGCGGIDSPMSQKDVLLWKMNKDGSDCKSSPRIGSPESIDSAPRIALEASGSVLLASNLTAPTSVLGTNVGFASRSGPNYDRLVASIAPGLQKANWAQDVGRVSEPAKPGSLVITNVIDDALVAGGFLEMFTPVHAASNDADLALVRFDGSNGAPGKMNLPAAHLGADIATSVAVGPCFGVVTGLIEEPEPPWVGSAKGPGPFFWATFDRQSLKPMLGGLFETTDSGLPNLGQESLGIIDGDHVVLAGGYTGSVSFAGMDSLPPPSGVFVTRLAPTP